MEFLIKVLVISIVMFTQSCGKTSSEDASTKSVATGTGYSTPKTSNLAPSFRWDRRHGRNYLTPARNQKNTSTCGIFAAVGALEAVANIYFNQLLPVNDYSEQQVVSCYPGLSTFETSFYGMVGSKMTLEYTRKTGLVNESHSPFVGESGACIANNNPMWQPSSNPPKGYGFLQSSGGSEVAFNDYDIRKSLIMYGPLATGVSTLGHAMTLVGYEVSGSTTTWIYKRSYWPEENNFPLKNKNASIDAQYVYYRAPLGDVSHMISHKPLLVLTPIDTPPYRGHYKIKCEDRDGDGYYYWGLSNDGKKSCPSTMVKFQADCDDSNTRLGPFRTDIMGACQAI